MPAVAPHRRPLPATPRNPVRRVWVGPRGARGCAARACRRGPDGVRPSSAGPVPARCAGEVRLRFGPLAAAGGACARPPRVSTTGAPRVHRVSTAPARVSTRERHTTHAPSGSKGLLAASGQRRVQARHRATPARRVWCTLLRCRSGRATLCSRRASPGTRCTSSRAARSARGPRRRSASPLGPRREWVSLESPRVSKHFGYRTSPHQVECLVKDVVVVTLCEGSFFGEWALLSGQAPPIPAR